ncbi:MAG: iron-containing alcohol dehydrogenase [Bryobacteraceae bacterium]|nr:iron-containing alcohol dehydrogenase [Bryobacteraceae bacterium]
MTSFEWTPRTRVVFGPGASDKLGELARSLGFRRSLLVGDAGIVAAGLAARAVALLETAGIAVFPFHDFAENPDSAMAERGRHFAAAHEVDSVIGFGGGSSLDCAKAINFLLTNGGAMRDYRGYGKTTKPLLPMISVTTTAGTGSEAQSYAVVSDAETHVKMACGDPSAAVRIAVLDPQLLVSAPRAVRANSGYDAIAHAVETLVTTKRTPFSELFSREAWRRLSGNYERILDAPDDIAAQAEMQLGAHLAGAAIEASMLGATHACANPLTARHGVTHGVALAVLLPHVVRWNESVAGELYQSLDAHLALRLHSLARAAGLPSTLRELGVPEEALPQLAADAAQQWTGQFNPRPFDEAGAREIYRCAF